MKKFADGSTPEELPSRPFVAGRWRNIIAAVLLLGVAAVIIAQSTALGPPGRASDPGAGGYPTLVAVVLACLAILLALQRDTGEQLDSLKSAGYVGGVVALLCLYAVLLGQLGYIISTSLFLIGALLLMNVRSVKWILLIAVVFSIALFALFFNLFGVSLPRGTVERLIS